MKSSVPRGTSVRAAPAGDGDLMMVMTVKMLMTKVTMMMITPYLRRTARHVRTRKNVREETVINNLCCTWLFDNQVFQEL